MVIITASVLSLVLVLVGIFIIVVLVIAMTGSAMAYDDDDDFDDGNANTTAKGSDEAGGENRCKDYKDYHINPPRADAAVIGTFIVTSKKS